MEQKTIEKVLNQISEERLQDHQELKNVKSVQDKQQQSIKDSQDHSWEMEQQIGVLKMGQESLIQYFAEPIKQLKELGTKIDAHSELLNQPVKQKIIHEHHASKLLYATITLFCVVLALSFGWFQTGQRLGSYRNNDTKWRRLILAASPALTKMMEGVSISVEADPEKARDSVAGVEAHNQQVWELHQKMLADSIQMRELEGARKAVSHK